MARTYVVPSVGEQKDISPSIPYSNPISIQDGGAVNTPRSDIIDAIRQAAHGDALQLESTLAEMATA